MRVPEKFGRALERLNMIQAFILFAQEMQRCRSFEQAQARVEQWHKLVDQTRKQMAMAAHPDRGGTVEAMQEINAAVDELKKVEASPPPPPRPQMRVVRVVMHGFGGTVSTNSGTTTCYTTGATNGWSDSW